VSAALAAGTVLVVAARPDGRLHVAVLAVGAAPAVLVTTPDGGRALVDGGSDPARLAQAVGTAVPSTLRTIDVLIVTGAERAAIAGLDGLRPHYTVSHVVAPDIQLTAGAATLLASLRASGVDIASAATSWSWGGASWRFVCAGQETTAQGAPMPGCALQVAAQDGTALLLGDVAPAQQEEVAGLFGASLATDLVVAPPGGALAAALVDVAHPRHLAIPSARAVRRNQALGGLVERDTATDGTLEYAGSNAGLVVA
jgi:beta-lactamase superfamily II metal-dependent hydrolase